MASQQRAEFVLKRPLPVMHFLVLNGPFHRVQVRVAHGKRTLPRLPGKVGILWAVDLHPLRRQLQAQGRCMFRRALFAGFPTQVASPGSDLDPLLIMKAVQPDEEARCLRISRDSDEEKDPNQAVDF